tara:strand:+ start:23753 stop:24277 length:525 start_codon:yes stop_codon:yes gene_type:complete
MNDIETMAVKSFPDRADHVRSLSGNVTMNATRASIRRRTVCKAKSAHRRTGATMIEFAVVAPLLFLFFFAAFEFCRVAMIRHTADNAVYEAARVAIIPGATADEARNQAAQVLNTLGLTNVNIAVTPAVIRRDTNEVTISVQVPLDGNSFVPNQFFGGKSVQRQLTMQREGARS